MRLIILGAGGYGRTVADVAAQTGRYDDISFLDDASVDAKGACSEYQSFKDVNTEFYPAFGNNTFRLDWIKRLKDCGCEVASIIHPGAYVSPSVKIGMGSVILPGAIINTGTQIGEGCIVNCGAIVDHGCILSEGVHVCLGAIVKAENRIPACMKIDAGQVVTNREYPL